MKKTNKALFFIAVMCLCLPAALFAQSLPIKLSAGQRELGVVILADLSVKDGVLSFTAPSGGCTDKSSFKVTVKKEKGISEKTLHYILSVERIKADDCKALLAEGVTIAFDLEKDLGLKGAYTFAVANPLYSKSNRPF
jgi:hypothetical protein